MSGYQIVAQFDTGAVLIMLDRQPESIRVIDIQGRMFTLGRYLKMIIKQRS
jgi:hypothetical protein